MKNASRIIPDISHCVVEDLCKAAAGNDSITIRFLLEQLIPGYTPDYSTINPQLNGLKVNTITTNYLPEIGASVVKR